MILFMEKTWFLWWMFAVVVILRWFHVSSVDARYEDEERPIVTTRDESHAVGGRLASGA